MPMGPVELADTVGLDVCLMVTGTLNAGADASSATQSAADTLRTLVNAGHLGRKSGKGFYTWSNDKARKQHGKTTGQDLAALSARLIKVYTAECQAALRDGIVADADLLDAGMIFGTGFAPFRGGPLHYLQNSEGAV